MPGQTCSKGACYVMRSRSDTCGTSKLWRCRFTPGKPVHERRESWCLGLAACRGRHPGLVSLAGLAGGWAVALFMSWYSMRAGCGLSVHRRVHAVCRMSREVEGLFCYSVRVIHDMIIDAVGSLKLLMSLDCMDHAGFVFD